MTEEQGRYEECRQREFAERFSSALETWRFEVDSHWTRTAYFSLFQAGSFVAVWTLLSAHHIWTCIYLCGLGMVLSLIWLANDVLMHRYIDAWWKRARDIEEEFDVTASRKLVWDFAKRNKKKSWWPEYRYISRSVPIVFLAAWIWMFIWCLRISLLDIK
jgi:hypothetical protein